MGKGPSVLFGSAQYNMVSNEISCLVKKGIGKNSSVFKKIIYGIDPDQSSGCGHGFMG
jgi:hypothetical protein